jgi:hypothetical protein
VDKADLARLYRDISDEELMRMGSSGTLTALAQEIAEAELASRGIDPLSWRAPERVEPAGAPVTDFETVFTTMDWNQAQVYRGRLAAEGIPIYIGDAHTNQTDPLLTPALGGFRIRVPVERAREARELIAALQAGKFALDE